MAAPIVLAVGISAPAETIFDAISTTTGLASFWTTDSTAEPSVGSVARFGFGGPKLQMRVDQLDPGRRIAWTCLTEFPQTELAATAYTWALILGALKAYAETGKAEPVFAITAR